MDWTHPETWFTSTWYNRRQDEGKSYKRKETATNAKWCNQQVLWRVKERGWRQKLVEENGVINLPSKAENRRETDYNMIIIWWYNVMIVLRLDVQSCGGVVSTVAENTFRPFRRGIVYFSFSLVMQPACNFTKFYVYITGCETSYAIFEDITCSWLWVNIWARKKFASFVHAYFLGLITITIFLIVNLLKIND